MTTFEKMVEELTRQFKTQALESLPRVIQGCLDGERSGSFSATVQISPERHKKALTGWKAEFKPRERVPLETTEWKLKFGDEYQLELFELADSD